MLHKSLRSTTLWRSVLVVLLAATLATLAVRAWTGPTAPPAGGNPNAAGSPVGTIVPYGGSAAPSGWLLADGSAVNRTTYAALFAAIGTAYGVGDGSTTFNIPDLQGRVAVGKAGAGGHADVTTLAANDGVALASRRSRHNHNVTYSGSSSWYAGGGGTAGPGNQGAEGTTSITSIGPSAGAPTDTPAYLILNYIIKY